MGFKTPSLKELQERHYEDLRTRLGRTPGDYDILKINSAVNAGMFHLLHENLRFLSLQLFPDTAEGEFLDAHWAWRSKYRQMESFASGTVEVSGTAGARIPAGHSWESGGVAWAASKAAVIGADGKVVVEVRALTPGKKGNVAKGAKLTGALPLVGVEAEAESLGIRGGSPRESNANYRQRMIASLRDKTRYGKKGDWAAWALDSSSEVVKAWEFPFSDARGLLLIQVLGPQDAPVANLAAVKRYIEDKAPPALWAVETPAIQSVNVTINIQEAAEDTAANRTAVATALRAWLAKRGKPGMALTVGLLSNVASSPAGVTYAQVTFPGAAPVLSIRQYPKIGVITWA